MPNERLITPIILNNVLLYKALVSLDNCWLADIAWESRNGIILLEYLSVIIMAINLISAS